MHETFPELPAWLFDLVFPSMKSRKPMAKPTTARGESYEHKPCREELSLEVISPLNHAPERQLRFGVRASDMKRPLHSRRGGHSTFLPESANPVWLRSNRERVTLCCGSDCALAVVCCELANVKSTTRSSTAQHSDFRGRGRQFAIAKLERSEFLLL